MPAAQYDIEDLEAGTGYSISFAFEALDLTGSALDMQIRSTISSAILLEFTSPASGIVLTSVVFDTATPPVPTSTVTVTFTGAQTAVLSAENVYDIKETPVSGEPTRLIEGSAFCKPAVTR